jgi:hypothetical protein
MLGLISEIGLHHNKSIPSCIPCATRDFAHELVDRDGVSTALLTTKDRERDYIRIRLERLERSVGAAVVVDHDLVLARVLLKNPADAPEEYTDSLTLVVGRNTDVDQCFSTDRVTTGGAHRQDRRGG